MKTFTLLAMLLLTACATNSEVEKRLLAMYEQDQSIRHQQLALTKAITTEGQTNLIDSLIQIIDIQQQIDQRNATFVDSLLQAGLPKELSDSAYHAIWIIIDHANLDMQEKHLSYIRQMAEERKIKFKEYATLYDRIEMKNNRPQRYGTQIIQFGTSNSPQLYLWPVEDEYKLDSLRLQVGFDSISTYLDEVSKTMGTKANYNPSLTIRELNAMREIYNIK